jgi:hypothetical protein
MGWRGFADYVRTSELDAGLQRPLARQEGSALMCAEAVAWRCHRSLVADALIVLGTRVEHVMNGKTFPRAHSHFFRACAAQNASLALSARPAVSSHDHEFPIIRHDNLYPITEYGQLRL